MGLKREQSTHLWTPLLSEQLCFVKPSKNIQYLCGKEVTQDEVRGSSSSQLTTATHLVSLLFSQQCDYSVYLLLSSELVRPVS